MTFDSTSELPELPELKEMGRVTWDALEDGYFIPVSGLVAINSFIGYSWKALSSEVLGSGWDGQGDSTEKVFVFHALP